MPRVSNDGGGRGRGDGPGHLFAQTKVGWHRMGYVDALATRGKVVVADPRGFGDSSRARADADYSLDAFCDDLLAAADAATMETFVAFGYSNTAALAVALACRAPDRVVGVACCGMDPLLDFASAVPFAAEQARLVGEGAYDPEGTFDWRAAMAFYRDFAAWQPTLPAPMPCPAVIVHGADDELIAPSVAANRADLVERGFEIVAIDGKDHQTCIEASDAVVAAVLAALG